MTPSSLIESKISRHERLDSNDGLYLLTEAPLLWLGRVADELRLRRHPPFDISFVVDSNPNYTNICDTDCHFCAFYRRPKDIDAYTLSIDEVMKKIERCANLGATTILLQGGHNRELRLDYYLSLIRETRKKFPHITPHFFTASEIQTMASVENMDISAVLEQLKQAGQHTLPGGGAEILSDRVRLKIAPKKGGAEKWLSVHKTAHELGFASTATMMVGHVEEPIDIIQHWNYIRDLQDRSLEKKNGGGFTAFIPWSFKPNNTVLERRFPKRMGPVPYLRMIAASRIYLDNFDHIQASWFSEGKKTGQIALRFGADDFGGTLYEENVHAEAGFINVSTRQEIINLIHEAGFDAVQRTTRYELINRFPRNLSSKAHSDGHGAEFSIRKNNPVSVSSI